MLLRLDHIAPRQVQATGVTAEAVTWRAFKQTIDVTRLAARRRVHAGQRKPGFQVVKIARQTLCLQACNDG